MVRCSLPLPISSSISVIFMPRRTQARLLRPRLREAGLHSHSAIIVSNPSGVTGSPWRASTMRSYFKLCPTLGIFGSSQRATKPLGDRR